MNSFAHARGHRQQGAVLLIGMVLLLVLTITALVAMQLVSNQNRVAANAWGAQMSLATGEAALSAGEAALLSGTITENFAANANGAYTFDAASVPQWAQTSFDWSGTNVLAAATFTNSQYPQSVANVIVEQLPSVAAPGRNLCSGYTCNPGLVRVFRVTAKAVGPDGKLPALLQDTSVE